MYKLAKLLEFDATAVIQVVVIGNTWFALATNERSAKGAYKRDVLFFFLSLPHQIYKILILMHFNARK